MEQVRPPDGYAKGDPDKDFFVSMLTRDIDLDAAILDLLDNCLDGVQRQLQANPAAPSSRTPYDGYWAHLELSPSSFVIEDNCGGIERSIAQDRAFRMGKSNPGDTIGAIGMYGIGMKRAIFKLGTSARVETRHLEDSYVAVISPDWISGPDWDIPLYNEVASFSQAGTRIRIDMLHPEIAQSFDKDANNFINSLTLSISQHYALILEKGFSITINGRSIRPSPFLFFLDQNSDDSTRIMPYRFAGTVDGVAVDIIAGLYRRIPSDDEAEDDNERRNLRGGNAGWSIACNDRIVVYQDTSRLTGWGENSVPRYHGQYSAFSGLVLMSSGDPRLLPLTTTKRGLNTSTDVFFRVREQMQKATKIYTNFTNKWKSFPKERDELYASVESVSIDDVPGLGEGTNPSRAVQEPIPGQEAALQLPTPRRSSESMSRITFERTQAEVELVRNYLFGDQRVSNGLIGSTCFDRILDSTRPKSAP